MKWTKKREIAWQKQYQKKYYKRRRYDPVYMAYRKKANRLYEKTHVEQRRVENRIYYRKKGGYSFWKKYRDPEKFKARELARKIPHKKNCELCKKKAKTQRHHKDYKKPLDVMHLCRPCHEKIHLAPI